MSFSDVFLGTRPTSGHSVQIVEVRDESGLALTSPFYLVSVPARPGGVWFEQISSSPRPIR